MTTQKAMLDLCRKWGLCGNKGGCPLMTVENKQRKYLCNNLNDSKTIDILYHLGYDLDDFPTATISISESDIASILGM